MSRVRNGWLLTGVAVGSLCLLVGCAPKGTPADTSSIGKMGAAVPGTRWTSNSVATEKNVSDWNAYDGMAFGPGSAFPTTRYTLRNPSFQAEYLPAIDNPLYGAMSEEEGSSYRFPAVDIPSESYSVNGVDQGPSVDRLQSGIPVKGQ